VDEERYETLQKDFEKRIQEHWQKIETVIRELDRMPERFHLEYAARLPDGVKNLSHHASSLVTPSGLPLTG